MAQVVRNSGPTKEEKLWWTRGSEKPVKNHNGAGPWLITHGSDEQCNDARRNHANKRMGAKSCGEGITEKAMDDHDRVQFLECPVWVEHNHTRRATVA